jgi:hypothetical protein
VDETAGTVTCPAGNTRPISRTRVATFGALCRDCPLRQRCTKSDTGHAEQCVVARAVSSLGRRGLAGNGTSRASRPDDSSTENYRDQPQERPESTPTGHALPLRRSRTDQSHVACPRRSYTGALPVFMTLCAVCGQIVALRSRPRQEANRGPSRMGTSRPS